MRMHQIEETILSKIKSRELLRPADINDLNLLSLGDIRQKFYLDNDVKEYCKESGVNEKKLGLRLALEEYLDSDRTKQHLDKIEVAIQKLSSPMESSRRNKGLQEKAAGTYLMPVSSELMRQIYQLEDISLNELFEKHFPVPPTQLFKGHVPKAIKERDTAVFDTMGRYFVQLQKHERLIVKTQRRIRMK